VVKRAVVCAAVLCAACGDFDDPAIVLDSRMLAVSATPPEYVFEIDLEDPPGPGDVVDLEPFTVRALVADPEHDRRLVWSMMMCAEHVTEGGDGRCPAERPRFPIGNGVIEDPDIATPGTPVYIVHEEEPGADTFVLLMDTIENDPLRGFSGIDLQIQINVAPEGESLDTTNLVAAKRIRFAPKIPVERVANTNPTFGTVEYDRGDGELPLPLPVGRCVDQLADPDPATPIELQPGATLHLNPIEPPGVREDYVVPTLDGGSRMFTENISYQWLAGDGAFSAASTGGEKDPFGNSPPLDTEWTADEEAEEEALVPLWIVARDERLGAVWFESCVRMRTP
jgi:hypothetical protein